MSGAAFPEDRVGFGDIPPAINACLQDAVAAYADTDAAEKLLWAAQSAAPEQRAVYFALYKFYFYKYRLDDAERVALMALEISARQGGFSAVWETLTPLSTQWGKTDTPQHFFLFSLKALAFIRLRLGNIQGCHAILNKLRELDPIDQVGSSVILDLANRFTV